MATTKLAGEPVHTFAELPSVGTKAPDFTLTTADLGELRLSDLLGTQVVLNIFPSIDTGVCATSVRTFNAHAASLPNTKVVTVSQDLPFALGRFCAAEGIDGVITTSAFRSNFGEDYGVLMVDGALCGLLARSVIVVDSEGIVRHVELVDEIKSEPNYEAAEAALA